MKEIKQRQRAPSSSIGTVPALAGSIKAFAQKTIRYKLIKLILREWVWPRKQKPCPLKILSAMLQRRDMNNFFDDTSKKEKGRTQAPRAMIVSTQRYKIMVISIAMVPL